jgi:hypothetical protein
MHSPLAGPACPVKKIDAARVAASTALVYIGRIKMPLKGPEQDDIRKLGNEITQIVHQRFLVTTTAITIFGAAIAWMLPQVPRNVGDPVGPVIFALAVLLEVLLFALYLWNHILKIVLRTFTTYLMVTGKSPWESDWEQYRNRNRKHFGYTKAQTLIFVVLEFMACGFPFLLGPIFSLNSLQPLLGAILCLVLGVVFLLVMLFIGYFKLGDQEAQAKQLWTELK